MPVHWGMAEQIWCMKVMEYYCAIRDDERDGFRDTGEEWYELIHSEVNKPGEWFKE